MPKEIKNERSKYYSELCEVLDKEFPKHQCKERGHALVLLAYAEIALHKQKEELITEIEKMRTMPIIEKEKLIGANFTNEQIGFNQALDEVLKLLCPKHSEKK